MSCATLLLEKSENQEFFEMYYEPPTFALALYQGLAKVERKLGFSTKRCLNIGCALCLEIGVLKFKKQESLKKLQNIAVIENRDHSDTTFLCHFKLPLMLLFKLSYSCRFQYVSIPGKLLALHLHSSLT